MKDYPIIMTMVVAMIIAVLIFFALCIVINTYKNSLDINEDEERIEPWETDKKEAALFYSYEESIRLAFYKTYTLHDINVLFHKIVREDLSNKRKARLCRLIINISKKTNKLPQTSGLYKKVVSYLYDLDGNI